MNRFSYLFFVLIFEFSLVCDAQNLRTDYLEFSPQISLAVFSSEKNKLNGTAFGGEFIYHIDASTYPKEWEKRLKVKSLDLVLNYKNMRNIQQANRLVTNEFANSYAVLAALNIQLFNSKNLSIDFSPGFGFAYVGLTWFTNQNALIGSNINFASRAALKVVAPINLTTKLSGGFDVLHYSNSGLRIPNNGMNLTSMSLGIIRSLNSLIKSDRDSSYKINYKRHSIDFGVNIGRRGVYHSKNSLYKSGLYLGYNYRMNTLFSFGGGIDGVYYFTVYNPNSNQDTYQSTATSLDRWRIGAAVGPDLWMGKLALMVKYGFYLYFNSVKSIPLYWTAGLKYNITNRIALQAKAFLHGTEADFAGFGIILNK